MKPSKIFDVLNMTMTIRKNGGVYNPLFVGPPGVGKSQIVQQWAKENNLPFIDLRAAYLEAPDVIGFPSIETVNGVQTTVHNIPEFWPQSGEGVLLLEEPNRGTTSIMNTFMQLLTDRKIHKYSLPEGWIIVGCINPEGENYDVNTMDSALKNRFVIYDVTYDRKAFTEYMRDKKWHQDIINFVESNSWSFKAPEEIGEMVGNQYNSPRTFAQLNEVLKAMTVIRLGDQDEVMTYQKILGVNVGRDFYNFRHNETPVLLADIVKNPKEAFKRLDKYCDPKNLKSGMIAITVQDILLDGNFDTIKDDVLVEVIKHLPVDHGVGLIRDLEFKRKDNTILEKICKNYPEVKQLFKDTLKHNPNK